MSMTACIFGCSGLELTPQEAEFFESCSPFGFILFDRNIENVAQIRQLTRSLRSAVGSDRPIFIDQEGGRVQRLHGPQWRDWLPPLEVVQGLSAPDAEQALASRYRIISRELRDLGIDGNCVPVADLPTDRTHAVLRNRCLAHSVEDISRRARKVSEVCLSEGIYPVVKHMPGHGRAVVDSHIELPVVDAPLHELEQTDFRAFKALHDLPIGMTAHVAFSCLDPGVAATLSRHAIAYIRDQIGFDGLLMTDDIAMEALAG